MDFSGGVMLQENAKFIASKFFKMFDTSGNGYLEEYELVKMQEFITKILNLDNKN